MRRRCPVSGGRKVKSYVAVRADGITVPVAVYLRLKNNVPLFVGIINNDEDGSIEASTMEEIRRLCDERVAEQATVTWTKKIRVKVAQNYIVALGHQYPSGDAEFRFDFSEIEVAVGADGESVGWRENSESRVRTTDPCKDMYGQEMAVLFDADVAVGQARVLTPSLGKLFEDLTVLVTSDLDVAVKAVAAAAAVMAPLAKKYRRKAKGRVDVGED